MKKIVVVVVTTLCLCLVACQSREKEVNLEKSGEKYCAAQGVSFYYPNDYTINLDAKDSSIVEFSKDNNTLYFKVIKDETDNAVDDKDELYTGELEQDGARDIEVSQPVLDSGLSVFQYVFTYPDTGIKIKEIVYFGDKDIYVYGYHATIDDFEANEKQMSTYLQSFSKSTGK